MKRIRERPAKILALPVALLALSACASPEEKAADAAAQAVQEVEYVAQRAAEEADAKIPEHIRKCRPSEKHVLPTPTNVTSTVDKRRGKIYACQYFLDMGLPFDGPAPIGKISEKTVSVSGFNAGANIGGLLIFGSGFLSGGGSASGSTKEMDLAVFALKDADGVEREIAIDATKNVSKKFCEDECTPTVTIELPAEPLFEKKRSKGYNREDNKSIWLYSNDAVEDAGIRQRVVMQVSEPLPQEMAMTTGFITGGPAEPGKVITALAQRIIFTLPASAR